MKNDRIMKKIILYLILFITNSGYAQISVSTNYYNKQDVLLVDGITYDVKYGRVLGLCNKDNRYINEPNLYYQDGRMVGNLDEYNAPDATMNRALQVRAVREAFGDERIRLLRKFDRSMITLFYVVGPDGTTMEVAFLIDAEPELLAVPPGVYAELERLLKSYVKWSVNDAGRKLKFLHMGSHINFRNIPLTSELITVKKDVELETGLEPLD